jgi:dsDNA-binding SOS-regulon protein
MEAESKDIKDRMENLPPTIREFLSQQPLSWTPEQQEEIDNGLEEAFVKVRNFLKSENEDEDREAGAK